MEKRIEERGTGAKVFCFRFDAGLSASPATDEDTTSSLSATTKDTSSIPSDVEGSKQSERSQPNGLTDATVSSIRDKLSAMLPEFDARVAMRFVPTESGFGWQGAVLLVRSEGVWEPAEAVHSFASRAIEAAVDQAVWEKRKDLGLSSKGYDDPHFPVTRILDEEQKGESAQELDAPHSERYESRPTSTTRPAFPAFVTSALALLFSAISLFGFAYLIFHTKNY